MRFAWLKSVPLSFARLMFAPVEVHAARVRTAQVSLLRLPAGFIILTNAGAHFSIEMALSNESVYRDNW